MRTRVAVNGLRMMTLGLAIMGGQSAARADGTLSTHDGKGISGERLRELLDEHIPTDEAHSTLIVLTQCYGGDMVDELSDGRDDTAVISATSEGETAEYGGYDDDAAEGLKPEAGRDSDDVHEEGTDGKGSGESPSQAGDAVPLDPVDPVDGPIKSRHILVYAGSPDGGNGTSDEEQLETIKDNFSGEDGATTTITSVGGEGTGVWDYPGTEEGLEDALEEIEQVMNEHEQFIMFVTDHGGQETSGGCTESAPGYCESGPLILWDPVFGHMEHDEQNIPGITLYMPTEFPPPPVMVLLDGMPLGMVNFPFRIDLNNNGVQEPGDGWEAWIPIPEEQLTPGPGNHVALQGQFFNTQPIVRISSGAIRKTSGGESCDGDTNGDGAVDPLDTGYVLARFGCEVGVGNADCDAADANSDNLVDPLDAGYVAARFGPCS